MTAKQLQAAHVGLALVWAALMVPTMLWWKESVLFVAFASIYANVWIHIGGYGAARAEDA